MHILFHLTVLVTTANIVELFVVVIVVVSGLVHVLELESLVDFLKGLENLLSTTKHRHPDLSGEFLVILQYVVFIKNPRGNLIL